MILKSGEVSGDITEGFFLTLRGFPCSNRSPENADVPYIKVTLGDKSFILEYIYVPERMRGYKLSYELLKVLFEFMAHLNIKQMELECLCKPYWRKLSQKYSKLVFFPPAGSRCTDIVYIRSPHALPAFESLENL